MKPTIVRLDSDMLARLKQVADATGHSVASIIRHCVEKRLPELEARFKENVSND